jgi:hypothetical protein
MSSAAAVKNELARAGHPPDRVRGRAAALGDVARRESGLQKNLDLMAFHESRTPAGARSCDNCSMLWSTWPPSALR